MRSDLPAPPPEQSTAAPRRLRWLSVPLVLLPLAPLGGAAWALTAAGLPDYALDGDGALIELRVRAAAEFQQQLGSYSRLGFDHPGPLHFYLAAPVYAAGGARSAALNLAVVAVQAAALAAALGLAFRAGGLAVLAALSLAATAYVAALGQVLITIWDPAMAILPTLACLAAAAAFGAGRRWAAVPAVLAGSFAVQAHLSLLPPVLAAWAAGLVGWRRSRPRQPAAPALWTALAAGLLSAAPPLVEQLTTSPGNLTRIAQGLGGGGPRASLGDALSITAAQATAPFRELLGGLGTGAAWLGCAALLAGLALTVCRARGEPAVRALAEVALAALLVAPLAVERIVGEVRPHMLQWIATAGVAGVAALAAAGLAALRGAARQRRLTASVAVAVALLALGWQAFVRLTVETLVFVAEPARAAATPGLGPALERLAGTLHARGARSVALRVLPAADPLPGHPDFTVGAGLVLGLAKRGFAVAPEPRHAFAYPPTVARALDADLLVVVHDARSRDEALAAGQVWDALDLGTWGFVVRSP